MSHNVCVFVQSDFLDCFKINFEILTFLAFKQSMDNCFCSIYDFALSVKTNVFNNILLGILHNYLIFLLITVVLFKRSGVLFLQYWILYVDSFPNYGITNAFN